MEFESLVKSLSERIGGDELHADANGVVALEVDDMRLKIRNDEAAGTVALVGYVGEPPEERRLERLYRALLEANHLFAGTGGATFSTDPESGDIVLGRSLERDALDGDSFCAVLTTFVNTLESWIRLLNEYKAQATSAPEHEPAGVHMMSV